MTTTQLQTSSLIGLNSSTVKKLTIALLLTLGSLWIGAIPALAQAKPKNVVFVMLDDADWYDFGCTSPGGDAITPNIDMLCRGGRLMDRYYTASCVCSPTRISVLTGSNPIRFGGTEVWPDSRLHLQSEATNSGLPNLVRQLGSTMKSMGKATGFFGKWHVGQSRAEHRPDAMGFHEYSVMLYRLSQGLAWDGRFIMQSETERTTHDVDYLDEYFADQAIDFIHRNKDNPNGFFLDFCPFTPHFPLTPPRDYDNSTHQFDLSTSRGNTLAMMHAIDTEIGRIVAKLKSQNLFNDTLFVVTSDNGGIQLAQNLEGDKMRGTKGNFLERGIRVPLIAHWPGGIPANSINSSLVLSYDLFPTFVDFLGGNVAHTQAAIDGRTRRQAFTTSVNQPHAPVVWELNGNSLHTNDVRAQQTFAARFGDHKIIKYENRNELTHPKPFVLYNVIDDPKEKNNLATVNPGYAQTLYQYALSLRRQSSRLYRIPSEAIGPVVVRHDPRMDVGSRDMTLRFEFVVPYNPRPTRKNLYRRGIAQQATLLRNGQVLWRVIGSDLLGNRTYAFLRSKPLSPGIHSASLSITGFKNDIPILQLYVDDVLVDEVGEAEDYILDNQLPMMSLWSEDTEAFFGDEQLVLVNMRYHVVRRFPDELGY